MANKLIMGASGSILSVTPPMQDIYDAIYPIGSHYIGLEAPTVPNKVSASWVKDDTYNNKALWVDNSQTPGTELAGSLPKIEGQIWNNQSGVFWSRANNFGGAFTATKFNGYIDPSSNKGDNAVSNLYFKAENSNSIYGAAAGTNVVRPTSIVINVWKREA